MQLVDYHKKLGFDNIILYDNNYDNEEYFEDVINDYIKSGFVKLENARNKYHYQIQCYSDAYNKYHKYFDWIAFIDCDEFITLKNNTNIKDVLMLNCFNDFNCIRIAWENYDDNNLCEVINNNYNVLSRFTHKGKYDPEVKSIIRTTINKIENTSSHINFTNEKIIQCNSEGIGCNFKVPYINNPSFENIYIRHYRTKTIEEFILNKMKRGWPTWYEDIHPIDLNLFFEFNSKTIRKIECYKKLIK